MNRSARKHWKVLMDCQVTRAKRYHIVLDTNGDHAFTSPSLEGCFEWAFEQGVRWLVLVGDRWTWQINIANCWRLPTVDDARAGETAEAGQPF